MILYDYHSGLTQHESIDRLHAAFGDNAPSRTRVFEWFAEFRRGRRSLDNATRSGRPVEVTTEDKVAVVRVMVEEDVRMTSAVGENHGDISRISCNDSAREARPQQSLRALDTPIDSMKTKRRLE